MKDYVLKLGFLVDDLLARIRVRLEEIGVLAAQPKAPSPLESGRQLTSRPLARLGEALQILGVTNQQAVLGSAGVHAQFCSRWMERFCPEMPAAALVGLCHDLPELLLIQRNSAEGWMSLKEVARSRGKILPHLVEELFGIPYGEFVSAVLRKIGLPDEVVTPIVEHANAFLGASPVPATRDALRLESANQWAHAFLAVPTRNVPIRLVSREENEPRLRPEDRIEIAQLLERAWSVSSQVFQGMEMVPESFRLQGLQHRPRLVIQAEGWVQIRGALEHLLSEVVGQAVPDPVEELADSAWDALVYLGDHPAKAFPNGYPYAKLLVVLHRLAKDACRFPQAARLETLRMPASLVQLERLLSGLA